MSCVHGGAACTAGEGATAESQRAAKGAASRGLQYKCKTAAEMRDSCKRERARLLTVTEARRAAREAAGVVGKRSRPIFCAHHAPVAACAGDDGFELYECDVCGVCVGQECSHVCGGAATEDSDTRNGEDGECDACGQLSHGAGRSGSTHLHVFRGMT